MDVSRETPDVTTQPKSYDFTNIPVHMGVRQCARYVNVLAASCMRRACIGYASGMHRVCIGVRIK